MSITNSAEIHRHLVKVYGEGVMNEGNVRKWCRLFNGGRTDVHNEARSGRPSVTIEDLKDRVDAHVRAKQVAKTVTIPLIALTWSLPTFIFSPKIKEFCGGQTDGT
jgi:hypothetical protein